jgi:prepilin-type N-terminal cleavage/methylation domain-containing protein
VDEAPTVKPVKAFTLVEILTVIVILAIIAAIAFSVLAKSAKQAKSAPCTSNLRQIGIAWTLYRDANNGTWPRDLQEFGGSESLAPLLVCPIDPNRGGSNSVAGKALGTAVSYYYVQPAEEFRQTLYTADPNAGILYCVLHGSVDEGLMTVSNPVLDTEGSVLRLAQDLSVTRANVGHLCMEGGLKTRSEWMLLSDEKCPAPYCPDGSFPCD